MSRRPNATERTERRLPGPRVGALEALLATERTEVDRLATVNPVGRCGAVFDNHATDRVLHFRQANALHGRNTLAYLAFERWNSRAGRRRMTSIPGEVEPRLAVDFANTVACPGCRGADALLSANEAERWIQRKIPREGLRIGPGEMTELRTFRVKLRELLEALTDGTPPSTTALSAVNRAAARTTPYAVLRWTGRRWTTEEMGGAGTVSHRFMSAVARSAVELIGGSRSPGVRRCAGPGCVHFLLVRRSGQRWCSPTGCGNRARVQRHYRKVHDASDSR